MNFFLSAKFRDLLQTQKEADRTALVRELSKELRSEVLESAYAGTLGVQP